MSGPCSEPLPAWLSRDAQGVWRAQIWAQPGAKRSEALGERDGCLKVRLAAPAVENKANRELLDFIARSIGVRANQVSLARGERGRRKTVCVAAGREPDWSCLEQAGLRAADTEEL